MFNPCVFGYSFSEIQAYYLEAEGRAQSHPLALSKSTYVLVYKIEVRLLSSEALSLVHLDKKTM